MVSGLVAVIPPGRYGVAVSGGGDSVAALLAVVQNPAISAVVLHLDHQTRGEQSIADAAFVADLAARLKLPAVIRRRDEIASETTKQIVNPSARYRAARLDLYQIATSENELEGIILGHHADDQAETVLLRLLARRGPGHVTGMSAKTIVDGVVLLRPFLQIPSAELKAFALSQGFTWREDPSNQSPDYLRNRLRAWRGEHKTLDAILLKLHADNSAIDAFVRSAAPTLPTVFESDDLARLPAPLARYAARRWLISNGCDGRRINGEMCQRLIDLTGKTTTANFPGNLRVCRKGSQIAVWTVEKNTDG